MYYKCNTEFRKKPICNTDLAINPSHFVRTMEFVIQIGAWQTVCTQFARVKCKLVAKKRLKIS